MGVPTNSAEPDTVSLVVTAGKYIASFVPGFPSATHTTHVRMQCAPFRYDMNTSNIAASIEQLSPAYFALIMATGIISIAGLLFGLNKFASLLLLVNIISYVLLCILYVYRYVKYSAKVVDDLTDHAKSPGFLTFVAASNVLGVQFLLIWNDVVTAKVLFMIGALSWVLLIYLFFSLVIVKQEKPSIEKAISGVWLLTVVSTQSVSVLLTQLSGHIPFPVEWTLFSSLVFFLCGCMLYIIVITLIMYRLVFFTLQAEQFAPPYWINMGAVAITTLAGSLLIHRHAESALIVSLLPFLKGFTLLFWSIGTWWIPLVFILGIWRHWVKKIPLEYHPQYWGMVFPLGMYTVSTVRLAAAIDMPLILKIADVSVVIALVVWGIVFWGMIITLFRVFFVTRDP